MRLDFRSDPSSTRSVNRPNPYALDDAAVSGRSSSETRKATGSVSAADGRSITSEVPLVYERRWKWKRNVSIAKLWASYGERR